MKPNISITWTDGNFEKAWSASSIEEAKSIAKNTDYWPIEISDYSTMTTTISENGNEIETYDYSELCAL